MNLVKEFLLLKSKVDKLYCQLIAKSPDEQDPTVPNHVKTIKQEDIDNWNKVEDVEVQITENTDFAQTGQTQKDFNKSVSDYKVNSDLKNQEQDDRMSYIEGDNIAQDDLINGLQADLDNQIAINTNQDERINNLEGINYTWSPKNRTLTLYNNNGTQLSQVSLVSLDNEGTDIRYNASTLSLELYNADNALLDSIPVSSFIGSVGTQLQLNSNQLQLKDSQGNVLSTVSFTVSNIQGLQAALDSKLNKPTSTGNTTSYPFVVGEDGNGNSARLPAGDLGKNFFNSDLSNTTARNHTMNAGVTLNTLGNPHTLSGLPNKNADIANFRKVRVQNTSGLDSVVDSKNLLTDGVTSMTDAEKDAWRLAQRKSTETYNTSTPQISVVNPFLIKNTDNFPLAVTVTGSNLFIDLANSIVTMKRVKDSNGNTVSDAEINITQYVTNSESNNLIMLIYYNFYNVTTGYYELKIQNQYGLKNMTSPQFLIVEDYDLTPMLHFTVINSINQLVNNTTINNNAFEANLVPNVYGGILFDKLYDSINGDINCIFDLDLAIKIPRSDYVFGEIFLGLINNDSTNNISSTTFPKIGFKIYNINAWSAKITDVNTNNVLHTIGWGSDLVYYSKFKIFIKDGTYTITNVITGQVSKGFYNDFNELRFLISKTYSTTMAGGVLSVSVSNFKKL